MRGNISVEFAVALVIITVVALSISDLAALVLGVQFNDSTCTEATRVAADGPPDQASVRANVVIARAQAAKNWFASNIQMAGNATVNVVGASVATLKQSGGPVNGDVSVCTEVQVQLPVLGNFLGQNAVRFRTTRKFSFTYCYPTP